MKKFLSEMKWNDRTKLALAALATGAVLLFSMLFPLAFRSRETAEPDAVPASLEERAALFAAYWGEKGSGTGPAAETLELPDTDMTTSCGAVMQQLCGRVLFDRALTDTGPDGSEFLRISDGTAEMTVCHMWLERSGDWQNWLDVYFDAETAEIYYLYLSCGILADPASYTGVSDLNGDRVAALLTEQLGAALRFAAPEEGGAHTAVLSTAKGSICYRIECVAYDSLVDVKINCF